MVLNIIGKPVPMDHGNLAAFKPVLDFMAEYWEANSSGHSNLDTHGLRLLSKNDVDDDLNMYSRKIDRTWAILAGGYEEFCYYIPTIKFFIQHCEMQIAAGKKEPCQTQKDNAKAFVDRINNIEFELPFGCEIDFYPMDFYLDYKDYKRLGRYEKAEELIRRRIDRLSSDDFASTYFTLEEGNEIGPINLLPLKSEYLELIEQHAIILRKLRRSDAELKVLENFFERYHALYIKVPRPIFGRNITKGAGTRIKRLESRIEKIRCNRRS